MPGSPHRADLHFHDYAPAHRQDLELVSEFTQELLERADNGADIQEVLRALDPDPLRYMWVDEGDGKIGGYLGDVRAQLAAAPQIAGHIRGHGRLIASSQYATQPSVAVRDDGLELLTWIEWEPKVGERVIAMLRSEGLPRTPASVISGAPSDCFRPTALFDADGRGVVLFASSHPGHPTVQVVTQTSDGWSESRPISPQGAISFNQEAVLHDDGRIECTWQGVRDGRYAIYATTLDRGEPLLLSNDGNCWDPTIAALPGGGAAYAWSRYADATYDIMHLRSDQPVRDAIQLTSGTDYALHPSLTSSGDRLWCAFDVVQVQGHGGSGTTRLRPTARLGTPFIEAGVRGAGDHVPHEILPSVAASIHVAEVLADGLAEPDPEVSTGLEVSPSGLPQLASSPDGELALAYRVLRRLPLIRYYWETVVQTLGPDGWSPPTTFADSSAGLEEPAAAVSNGRVVVAWQNEQRRERGLEWTEGFGGIETALLREHWGEAAWHAVHEPGRIWVGEVSTTGASPPANRLAGQLQSSERVEARPWVDSVRQRYATTPGRGPTYNLYWGDLHRHSIISRCTAADEPSLNDYHRFSFDVSEYDFWALTDHAENTSPYQWWRIQKAADLYHVPNAFVPLYGFEWSSWSGHQNVIFGDVDRGAPIFSAFAEGTATADLLWEQLRRFPDHPAITIPHHPGSAMVPFDWSFYDDEYLRLVEIFQACRGNYESDGCFRQYSDGTLPGTFVTDALRRGYRFGFVGSSDHGNGSSYVGAYATSLDREAVFEALKARRTIAATARGIVLDVKVADRFMGEEGPLPETVQVTAHVEGYTDVARIDVVRNGDVVHSTLPDLDLPTGWIRVDSRVEWGGASETTDWSGRLTVSGGEVLETPFWSPEVVSFGQNHLEWAAQTINFGEMYGAQRGGVELTLVGPAEAKVKVDAAGVTLSSSLEQLRRGTVSTEAPHGGHLRIQQGTGGLTSLGARQHDLGWEESPDDDAWYYVRAILVDGEMAWSSPVWLRHPDRSGSA